MSFFFKQKDFQTGIRIWIYEFTFNNTLNSIFVRTSFFLFFSFVRTALSLNEIRTHLPRCHAQMPNSTMHLLQAFLSVGVLLRCRKDLSSGTLARFFDLRPREFSRYFSRWFERVWSLQNLRWARNKWKMIS